MDTEAKKYILDSIREALEDSLHSLAYCNLTYSSTELPRPENWRRFYDTTSDKLVQYIREIRTELKTL